MIRNQRFEHSYNPKSGFKEKKSSKHQYVLTLDSGISVAPLINVALGTFG